MKVVFRGKLPAGSSVKASFCAFYTSIYMENAYIDVFTRLVESAWL